MVLLGILVILVILLFCIRMMIGVLSLIRRVLMMWIMLVILGMMRISKSQFHCLRLRGVLSLSSLGFLLV